MSVNGEELARRVATNIDRLRQEANLTMSELIEESGVSRSAFYARLRYETSWTLDGLCEIAAIFDVDPSDLLERRHGAEPVSALVDAASVQRRLRLLQQIAEAEGKGDSLSEVAYAAGGDLAVQELAALESGRARVRLRTEFLDDLANRFGVASTFLSAPDADAAADLVEAQLELKLRLAQTGGQIGLRSLGDIPASALRAIAKSLQSGSS